jgi:hypothetical protein
MNPDFSGGDYDDDIEVESESPEQDNDLIEVAGKSPGDFEEGENKHSKKVQKRIDKLVYERNIEREQRQKLEAELNELRTSQHQQTTEALSERQKELAKEKVSAMEEGDYERVAQIDDEAMDIKVRLNSPRQQAQIQPPQTTQQATEQTPIHVKEWEQNNQWIFDKSQKAQFAKQKFNELIQQGYDYNDPDTLAELDSIVSRQFKREMPPSPGVVDRGYTVGNDDSNIGFSSRDKSDMEDFGLNPNDPKHRAMWVKNKRSARA